MRPDIWKFSVVISVIALLSLVGGCDRRCVSCGPTGPSTLECTFTVTPTVQQFPYQGGGGNVVVTTRRSCSWTATANAAWLTITATDGNSVSYSVRENAGPARTGTLSVAGQTVTVTQEGAPASGPPQRPTPSPTPAPACTYAVQETPQQFTYQGGNGAFSVSASRSDCAWTAAANVAWIAITGGSPGSGNGSVSYLVAGNGGAARTGTISVAGKTVTVNQSAKP